ncbi:MAG: response regulator [Akkermansiaceae bacterium]|nr:response regulator [Akkermansiaceae bacterium]
MPSSPVDTCILVVDDDRANRLVLEKRLGKHGYQIETAPSGDEAMKLLEEAWGDPRRKAPDVVVLDIMMPGIDGYEVLRRIRKKKSSHELPVIMATARDSSEDVVAALQDGANDYVTKPIDVGVLLARMQTHLALRDAHLALRNAQQTLIRAARRESIGFLAAGMAHEIRNPFAQIRMGLDSLGKNEAIKDDERAVETLARLDTALDRADEVVRKVMQFSAAEQLDLKPHDLPPLIDSILATMKSGMDSAGIRLETDFARDLPEVLLDHEEFPIALNNVLRNAVQAMPDGGTLTVRVEPQTLEAVPDAGAGRSGTHLRVGEEVVAIVVEDSGPGFPHGRLDAIFEPFFTTKPPGESTGLGLTVARNLVELHGGMLTAENRSPEAGLRVTIYLKSPDSFRTSV